MVLEGNEALKVLRNYICQGAPMGKKSGSSLNLQTLIVNPTIASMKETFVAQSIWKA